MKHQASKTTLLAILCSAAAPFGLAQEDEQEFFELDPFEVRAEEEPGDIAMDTLQIDRLQANDLSELLSNQSTLTVGGGASVAQKIYVRGFEDTMLNVTVDGAQQIGELYHHQTRLQLEPDFIKSIQLDAGSGAATNGAGALTGAMKITLKTAFDLLQPDQDIGSYAKAVYAFNGDDSSKFVGSAYGKLAENIGLIATYSHGEGDDYEDGNGQIVAPTGYTHKRGYVKLNGFGSGHEWSLSYESLKDSGTYFERPHMTNFSGNFILSDHEMNRETLTANHRFDAGDDRLDLKTTLYWTDSDYQNHRNTTGALYGAGEIESRGFDIRNSMRFESNGLTYGIDYREDDLASAQNATPPPYWGESEQSARVFGIYAQDDWSLTEDLTLSAGARYDNYRRSSDEGPGAGSVNQSDGISPNANLSWDVTTDLTLRATYSKAFRGITIREAFFSAIYVHDGDLEAEEADNVELGFAWEHDGLFVRGTAYEQNIDNYINAVFVGADVWGYWRNVGSAKVEGYEFEVGKHFQNAFVSLGVWDADNTFDEKAINDSDLGLGTNIGRTWNLKANYFVESRNLDLGLFARYVETQPNSIAPTAPDKESYFVTDLFASWTPFENDRLTLAASVKNLFNEFYYDHGTYGYHAGSGKYIGFPARGREISFSATVKF